MIEKNSETYYTLDGQSWPKFSSIEEVKEYARENMASKVQHVMRNLNIKVSRERNVASNYQTASVFIDRLSWDDMLEIRSEINRRERQIKKLDKMY